MPGTAMTACSIGRVTMSDIDCGGSVPGVSDDDDARKLAAAGRWLLGSVDGRR